MFGSTVLVDCAHRHASIACASSEPDRPRLACVQLQMIFHAVRKAQVDVQCRQRVMPDVADFATQALQFIANTAAHLHSLQLKCQLPALFSQVRLLVALRASRAHVRLPCDADDRMQMTPRDAYLEMSNGRCRCGPR